MCSRGIKSEHLEQLDSFQYWQGSGVFLSEGLLNYVQISYATS